MASSPDFKSPPTIFRQDSIGPNVNLLDQYREKLKEPIGTARFYGLPDRPLEKVFVELTVIEDFEIPRDAEYKALMDKELRRQRTLFPEVRIGEEEDDPEETYEERKRTKRKNLVRLQVKPEELLKPGKRSQVVGAPGCGKTTLLRWLALQSIQTSNRLPVFIELKTLKKEQFDALEDDFAKFLFAIGVKRRFDSNDLNAEQFTALENAFYEHYKTGRLVVLLDGLDEIAEAERHRLQTTVEKYSNSHKDGLTLIVSTRPYGYLRNLSDLKVMEIEPLSDIQTGQFLDHWCEKPIAETVKSNLRTNPNLRNLARFPFLLTIIAHLNSAGEIPRIELYRKIITELITQLDRDKDIQRFRIDAPNGVLKHRFLKRFAFDQLFEKPDVELSSRLVFHTWEILDAAQAFLRAEDPTISPPHLVQDVCATPLLREVEVGRFTFAHLTIQEFLAAEELSERDDCQKRFALAFFNRQLAEMEVLPMAIGLADDPNEFYDLLSNTPESFDFVRLRLEARSLRYHQKAVRDAYYQKWGIKLTDWGLGRIQSDRVFSDTVLNCFTGIEIRHFQNLISGFLTTFSNRSAEVAETLGRLGPASSNVIDFFISALRGEAPFVHHVAAKALGKLGSGFPNAINTLIDALADQDWRKRQSAADALGELGVDSTDVITALIKTLRDEDTGVRQSAADALGVLGSTSTDIIAALINTLDDEYADIRHSAVDALGKLGVASKIVIAGLTNTLGDQASHVRIRAADVLITFGMASPEIVATLVNALKDKDSFVREDAAEALGKLGIVSPDVIAALASSLADGDSRVRDQSAKALVKLNAAASPTVIDALFTRLTDQKDYFVRHNAAEVLGKLGKASPQIINTLINVLGDREFYVRESAARALGTLGATSPNVINALIKALCEQHWCVRQSAAEALGKLGVASPNVIAALVTALHDQDGNVRRESAKALGTLHANSPKVIAALVDALRDQDGYGRQYSAHALGRLGAASPDAIAILVNELNEENDYLCRCAAESLECFGFDSPVFLEGLKLMLSDPDPELQKMALRSIGYPSTDPGLLDDLKKLMESENPEISEAAEDAHRRYRFKLEMLGLLPA